MFLDVESVECNKMNDVSIVQSGYGQKQWLNEIEIVPSQWFLVLFWAFDKNKTENEEKPLKRKFTILLQTTISKWNLNSLFSFSFNSFHSFLWA